MLAKHLPLHFKYFHPRKFSSYSEHEKNIMLQLDKLDVSFITADQIKSSKHSSSRGSWGISKHYLNWYRQPYFHLLVLDCDETDYKRKLRPITKKWIASRRADNDPFAVLYLHNGKMRKKSSVAPFKTSTVIDKIRNDASKENFTSINVENYSDNDFADLFAFFKEGIFSTFIYNLKKFSHQLQMLEQTSNLPGWNFAQYFIIREGLALTCEMFHLYKYAYSHYVALELMLDASSTLDENEQHAPTTSTTSHDDAPSDPSNSLSLPSANIPSSKSSSNLSTAKDDSKQKSSFRESDDSNMKRSSSDDAVHKNSFSHSTKPSALKSNPSVSHDYYEQFPLFVELHGKHLQSLRIEPILDTPLIQTRKRISSLSVSRFEMSNYIFSRICVLLFKMKLPDIVARKAIDHFSSVSSKMLSPSMIHALKQNIPSSNQAEQIKLYKTFIHVWSYSNIRCIVEQCQQQAAYSMDGDMVTKLSCILGDLFVLARDHLEALGKICGLELGWEGFTIQEKFEVSSPYPGSPTEEDQRFRRSISSPKRTNSEKSKQNQDSGNNTSESHSADTAQDVKTSPFVPFEIRNFDTAFLLAQALTNQEDFDQIFLELSGAASRSYQHGDRCRLHLKLQGDIAAVRFKQRNFDETIALLKSLVRQLNRDGWEQLAGYFQIRLAECQRLTGKTEDYMYSILSILKNQNLPSEREKFFSQQFIEYDRRHVSGNLHLKGQHFPVTLSSSSSANRHSIDGALWSHHKDSAQPLSLFIEPSEIPVHFSSIFLHKLHTSRVDFTFVQQRNESSDAAPSVEIGAKKGDNSDLPSTTISLENFVIPPGESSLSVPIFFKKVGLYSLTQVTVYLEHLSFDLSVQPISQKIEVNHSKPGATISHATSECLIVGQKQWLHLMVDFSGEKPQKIKLDFSPSKSLTISNDDTCFECTVSSDLRSASSDTQQNENNSKQNSERSMLAEHCGGLQEKWTPFKMSEDNVIEKESIAASSQWHLLLPIECQKTSSVQCVVEKLIAHLHYSKPTEEAFFLRHDIDLNFYNPFLHFVYEKRLSEKEVMVQISLECTNQFPIQILGHSLNCNEQIAHLSVTNLNRDSVIHRTVEPESNLSFVYRMHHDNSSPFRHEPDENAFANFSLEFRVMKEDGKTPLSLPYLPEEKKNTLLQYPISGIHWKIPKPYLFRVNGRLSEKEMMMMHPVNFEFCIEKIGEESQEEEIIYEMEVDNEQFLVYGDTKKRLTVKSSKVKGEKQEKYYCSCTLLPIVCGHVNLPLVRVLVTERPDMYKVHLGRGNEHEEDSESFTNYCDEDGMVCASRMQYVFEGGRSVFVSPSQHDHIDALWKVDGSGNGALRGIDSTYLGTEGGSEYSQMSLKTPVIDFGEERGYSARSSTELFRGGKGYQQGSGRRGHRRYGSSEVSDTSSLFTVALGGSERGY